MYMLYIHLLNFIWSNMGLAPILMIGIAFVIFCVTWVVNRISIRNIHESVVQTRELSAIMRRTLDLCNNYVLRLDLQQKHAYNLHGNMLPEEGMGYQESFGYIHPDDGPIYRDFIMRLVKGENRTDECIFRWDVSGNSHLGQWRYLHDQGVVEYAKGSDQAPTNIFCTLTDVTELVHEENLEKEMTNRYRKMFEQSIVGLAFYDKNGHLLAVNEKMREILKFQSDDDPYYYDNTLFELPPFLDLLNHHQVEELYLCGKSVIVDRGVSCYTELRVHPICDDAGSLIYITISIRDITQERELYLQIKKNDMEIRKANEEIRRYETELQYLMNSCDMRFFRTSLVDRNCTFYQSIDAPEKVMTFDELIERFVDSPFRQGLMDFENYFNVPRTDLTHMYSFFDDSKDLQWTFIDSVPVFDDHGKQLGTYGIVRNVTSLIEKQEKLKQETDRANDSGRVKSVFMANMTHEIRTPLNSIVGFSDVLPMLSTPEEKSEIIKVIMDNCDMLMRLINDILAISSLDAGGMLINPENVDFARAFDDACESFRLRVMESGVEFKQENPYRVFETCLDEGRIRQVLTNFVTNAVKYTHQGYIRVGYRYEDGGLYIYCEDTGDGIPKEVQSKIFERFYKMNDFIQGTGLGLSICKAIADSCKGRIGVQSEGKDQGSLFWLWIPCEELKSERREVIS